MNRTQKVVMTKYKYKYTNTNKKTQIQIQRRTHKYKYKYRGGSEVKFWTLTRKKSFHGNGHISWTVRPTSLRHASKRSSLPARPEKHIRGSLTCPGDTGEPEAPVSGGHRLKEIGSLWVRRLQNWLRQKSELFCSFWPDLTILPWRAIKKLHRDTFGKSLGRSVAEKRPSASRNP